MDDMDGAEPERATVDVVCWDKIKARRVEGGPSLAARLHSLGFCFYPSAGG